MKMPTVQPRQGKGKGIRFPIHPPPQELYLVFPILTNLFKILGGKTALDSP